MAIASINPATGETLKTFAPLEQGELEFHLRWAAEAFAAHRRTSFAERADRMRAVADALDAERQTLARLITVEMGKPIGAAEAEVAKCARVCRFYAEHAEQFLADAPVRTEAARSYVRYEPLGVVLAVMPWNYPLWQVFRFAAPAVLAGNVALLKHASNVPQCALAIQDVFRRAGFADGVFQTLLVKADAVKRLIKDYRVAAVTLTGSTGAGRDVGKRAGKQLKPSVLELGGSDPFLVLPSADLEAAVRTAVRARTGNSGQSCIAAKRFIVHQAVYEQFEQRFVEGMKLLRVGDPLDPATDVGPLATERIREEVAEQVRASVEAGARLLCGGEAPAGPGWFYPPTVLAEVPEAAPVRREEVFGPVAALFRGRDLDEMIRLANDTEFGLGASAWTTDAAEQQRLVAELAAGMVFINEMVASDPRLPFGGIKQSGYGRELGAHGIREFVNVKTVWIAGADEASGAADAALPAREATRPSPVGE